MLNAHLAGRLKALVFNGTSANPDVTNAIGHADCALVSVPPNENGDPVLAAFGDALAHARHLRTIVYLSTVGVYGDHGGEWVDETTPPQPGSARGRARLDAERAWQRLGARCGAAVAVLRLAGIYGPGQNALVQIERGNARRIVKPGQVFNRIHVADIAQAIDAAFARKAGGIFNVADDEPSAPGDPLAFAAQLLGRDPPPEVAVRRSRAVALADGAELLAGMPARAQRQAQARARRQPALSDLPGRFARAVRGAMRPHAPSLTSIARHAPARGRVFVNASSAP